MREAWQCALADGNKAQIMDAFRAQQFSAEGFEPGEKLVEAAPKKDAPKKDAPKKAAPKKAAATSEPKKRGRPKKTEEAKPKPKKAKAEPKQLVAPKTKKSSKAKVWDAGPDPYGVKRKPPAGINDGGRRSGRHADDPAEDIDTDGFFVSPSALPA
jgi:outer membrane biosynthesis protein TonB